jgi:chromosomal replication initiation ATPase DnaA
MRFRNHDGMTRQLPLPFTETPRYHAEDFLAAPCNALARDWLARPDAWTNGRMVLWGEPGCGKSFMLHLWAQKTGAVIYQGGGLRGLPAAPVTPVAVDDADIVPEETALLHLLNAAAEAGFPVLLTSCLPPGRQTQALPDLGSRLRASLAVEISPPDDALLEALLLRLAAARQLRLNQIMVNYLLQHLPRTPGILREAVARLDRAALASGGRVTRLLAGQTLGDLLTPDYSGNPAEKMLSNGNSPGLPHLL